MALVSNGFELGVTLLDNSGNDTTLSIAMRETVYATVVTDVATVLTALAAVSGGEVASYRITQVFMEDALSLPTVGFQAEVSASLTTFIEDAGTKKGNFRIPMPLPVVFVATIGAGANVVNTALQAVLDYHALFTTAGVANISDGEIAGGLLAGVRVTRAKRGG